MKEIMSWPFKDPLKSGLVQFDHSQSNTNDFFSRKTTNKIFMYLLASFILQNFKKLLELIQSYDDIPFLGPKWPICPEQKFFSANHCYYFHLPIGPFHCAKFKKNSSRGVRVKRMCNFWAQDGPFLEMKIFSKNLLMSLVSFIHF